VLNVLAGSLQSSAEGQRLLDTSWHVEVDKPADVVIATITGEPSRHHAVDLAQAFLSASRVVVPGGKIVLLCEADPELGPSAGILRSHDDANYALQRLMKEKPADLPMGFMWVSAAQQAKLYLLSELDEEAVEEMFATPLQDASQVKKLIPPGTSFLVLPDAHKTMAVVKNNQP